MKCRLLKSWKRPIEIFNGTGIERVSMCLKLGQINHDISLEYTPCKVVFFFANFPNNRSPCLEINQLHASPVREILIARIFPIPLNPFYLVREAFTLRVTINGSPHHMLRQWLPSPLLTLSDADEQSLIFHDRLFQAFWQPLLQQSFR